MWRPLGALLVDELTGFIGYAVERAEHLDGSTQYRLQPEVDGEGKLPDSAWFDSARLELASAKAKIGITSEGK